MDLNYQVLTKQCMKNFFPKSNDFVPYGLRLLKMVCGKQDHGGLTFFSHASESSQTLVIGQT